MSLNGTPSSNRLHIGFFGKTNAGKSSLMNGIIGQKLAIVSSKKGTTTDPVQKAMELLPIGPVVMIDTPGLDDEGELGRQRIEKTFEILRKIDFILLTVDGEELLKQEDSCLSKYEKDILLEAEKRSLPYLVVITKKDCLSSKQVEQLRESSFWTKDCILVSTMDAEDMNLVKDTIGRKGKDAILERPLIADLLKSDDVVVLVTPIDEAAPKGRMILPQQQTIRDILDADAVCMVTKEFQLAHTLASLKQPPKMVVTDSQAFKVVNEIVPKEIPLTSFSILFARKKGNLEQQVAGAEQISKLKDGDRVLISEGCTHHRQCGDIGTEKLPKLLKKFTGKELQISFTSGTQFAKTLDEYALIIHCGACMLNDQEMKYRLETAKKNQIPMTNYGVAIAYMNGILYRSLEPFRK